MAKTITLVDETDRRGTHRLVTATVHVGLTVDGETFIVLEQFISGPHTKGRLVDRVALSLEQFSLVQAAVASTVVSEMQRLAALLEDRAPPPTDPTDEDDTQKE